ncbi:hypothetical protein [Jiangella alkaliphila]|uniref:Uncharacterized protein n=1 Tax=Jiangella alkaliphila TaxID=419479 RepID=A0A1H2IEE5_9ACTN|nr:hypothetical protein [Jiangella alkaliphila]SDU42529.1 hypothetical protein SAMN04488563_1654 [Jiangella alkaliphila]
MKALGRLFDVGVAVVPVDLGTAASTGKRLHLTNYGGVAIVGFLNNGTAAQAPVFDVQEHTAASSGTTRDLDVVATYYVKSAATLAGTETWTEVTQAAASEITNADWDDANQVLVVAEVEATALSADCEWISVTITDPGTAQVGAALYIMYDLAIQRAPQNLANPQA